MLLDEIVTENKRFARVTVFFDKLILVHLLLSFSIFEPSFNIIYQKEVKLPLLHWLLRGDAMHIVQLINIIVQPLISFVLNTKLLALFLKKE